MRVLLSLPLSVLVFSSRGVVLGLLLHDPSSCIWGERLANSLERGKLSKNPLQRKDSHRAQESNTDRSSKRNQRSSKRSFRNLCIF